MDGSSTRMCRLSWVVKVLVHNVSWSVGCADERTWVFLVVNVLVCRVTISLCTYGVS